MLGKKAPGLLRGRFLLNFAGDATPGGPFRVLAGRGILVSDIAIGVLVGSAIFLVFIVLASSRPAAGEGEEDA